MDHLLNDAAGRLAAQSAHDLLLGIAAKHHRQAEMAGYAAQHAPPGSIGALETVAAEAVHLAMMRAALAMAGKVAPSMLADVTPPQERVT